MDHRRAEQILQRFHDLSCERVGYVNDMKGGEYTEGYRDGYDSGWDSCYDACDYIISELAGLIRNEAN
jgi:hypothetical protein